MSDNSKQGWSRKGATFHDKEMACKFVDEIMRKAIEEDHTYFIHATVDIQREGLKVMNEGPK
jgi:hypothetical protein